MLQGKAIRPETGLAAAERPFHPNAPAHAKRANEGRELCRLGSASAFPDIAVFDDGTGFEIPAAEPHEGATSSRTHGWPCAASKLCSGQKETATP